MNKWDTFRLKILKNAPKNTTSSCFLKKNLIFAPDKLAIKLLMLKVLWTFYQNYNITKGGIAYEKENTRFP